MGGNGRLRSAGKNFEMIVAKWTQTHNLDVAVCLDGQIRLHFEAYVKERGILGVDAQAFDASDFRPACVTHGCPRLETAGKRDARVVGLGGAAEHSADDENCADQHRACNDYKQTDESLLAFGFHQSLLSADSRSSVSI